MEGKEAYAVWFLMSVGSDVSDLARNSYKYYYILCDFVLPCKTAFMGQDVFWRYFGLWVLIML